MKIKIVMTYCFSLILFTGFSQNKKEQIEALNFSLDSLKQIIIADNNEISQKNTVILNSEVQLDKLNSTINQINLELQNSKSLISNKEIELQQRNNEITSLKRNLQYLKDSIAKAPSNQKLDTLLWELAGVTWEQLEFDLKLLLPTTIFEKPNNNILVSKDNKVKIYFEYTITDWMDQDEGNPMFYKEKDAIDYYSKGLTNLEIQNKDGFVIKGKNIANEFVMVKGLYTDFSSMEGREKGSPKWLWSNTIILKIAINQQDMKEYHYISELLNKSFNINSISYK